MTFLNAETSNIFQAFTKPLWMVIEYMWMDTSYLKAESTNTHMSSRLMILYQQAFKETQSDYPALIPVIQKLFTKFHSSEVTLVSSI